MSKITTDDCKNFLVEYFDNNGHKTLAKEWKRASKYKDGDVVKRNFEHPVLGLIVVDEKSGSLSIGDKSIQVNTSSVSSKGTVTKYIQRDFTEQEKEAAAALIKAYIKREDSDDDEDQIDKLIKTQKWIDYQYALPSQFFFCFPKQVYHNDGKNIENGIESPMIMDGRYSKESLNVIFMDKNDSDPDLYASYALTHGVLPSWTDFCDEYHLEFDNDAPEMTVREWFKVLLEMGFEYKSKNECFGEDCAFEEELSQLEIEKSLNVGGKKDNQIKLSAKIKSLIKKDDDVGLKKLLDDGLDINMKVADKECLVYFAYKEHAPKCGDMLIERGADLWLDDDSFCTGVNVLYSIDRNDLKKLAFVLNNLEKQLPTNNLIGKISKIYESVLVVFSQRYAFDLATDFIKKILPANEVAQVIVNNMKFVERFNLNLLSTSILSVTESEYKAALMKNIDDEKVIVWALHERPVDIQRELIYGQPLLDYLKDEVTDLRERYENSRKGFIMVTIMNNGTRVSEPQRLAESHNKKVILLEAVENAGSKNNKPEMR